VILQTYVLHVQHRVELLHHRHQALHQWLMMRLRCCCCCCCCCLSLLQAAAQQRNAVAVLRRLPEFGVALLPAQLTALPDKQQLLHSVLLGRTSSISSSSSRRGTRSSAAGEGVGASAGRVAVAPWRRLGDVLELAELLGMGGQEEQQQVSSTGPLLLAAAWGHLPT
jgi:hypothetical protein